MIKKITALALCFVMMFSVLSYAKTFSDLPSDNKEIWDAVTTLSELGIISGMGDGTFKPYDSLTRAQFAKMAVCIMGKTKEAVATTDAFSDVKSTDWYSGYVNVVANDGIITGYPDGSFGANDALTYAQAVTVVVRLLGYNAEDVGHKWPQGYLDKAAVLSLTDNISFDKNAPITRSDAAIIIYRALFCDMKATKSKLVTKMGKNVYEDAVILATHTENASLLANEVKTKDGVFKYSKEGFDISGFVGCEGTLVVNDTGDVIAFAENNDMSKVTYTVSAVYGESNSENISVITENSATLTMPGKTKIYIAGEEKTADTLATGINAGSMITLFSENGLLKYAFVDEYKNQGPITYTGEKTVDRIFDSADILNAKVIRKGVAASLDDIEKFDVLYYSERTNTLYAYCDRVTGMYEKAYPMKANVKKVTLSGAEYSLATLKAVNKMNESADAFEIGDRVTLLFGEDGEVVDAVSLTDADYSMYGVVTGFGQKVSEEEDKKGRAEYYVAIMHTDGKTVNYIVEDTSYDDKIGDMCIVDFENSFAVLSFPEKTMVYGMYDKTTNSFGNYSVASDCKVMEHISSDASSAQIAVLNINSLAGVSVKKTDVINAVLNKRGELAVLYLDDVTGDSGIYGIVISDPGSANKTPIREGVYTILTKSGTYTYNGTHTSIRRGDCVEYAKGNFGTEIRALSVMGTGREISSLTDNIVTLDGKMYTLSDDAVVYMGENSSDMKPAALEDMVGVKGNISLFSEKTASHGGRVRIVRIYTN